MSFVLMKPLVWLSSITSPRPCINSLGLVSRKRQQLVSLTIQSLPRISVLIPGQFHRKNTSPTVFFDLNEHRQKKTKISLLFCLAKQKNNPKDCRHWKPCKYMRFREIGLKFKLTWPNWPLKMEYTCYQQLTGDFGLVLIIVEKPTKLCSILG